MLDLEPDLLTKLRPRQREVHYLKGVVDYKGRGFWWLDGKLLENTATLKWESPSFVRVRFDVQGFSQDEYVVVDLQSREDPVMQKITLEGWFVRKDDTSDEMWDQD